MLFSGHPTLASAPIACILLTSAEKSVDSYSGLLQKWRNSRDICRLTFIVSMDLGVICSRSSVQIPNYATDITCVSMRHAGLLLVIRESTPQQDNHRNPKGSCGIHGTGYHSSNFLAAMVRLPRTV